MTWGRPEHSSLRPPWTGASAEQARARPFPEEADGCPIILVCGPQDVGKSTFSRCLINQLLNRWVCASLAVVVLWETRTE